MGPTWRARSPNNLIYCCLNMRHLDARNAPLILLLGTVCADILQCALRSLLFPFHKLRPFYKLYHATREMTFIRETNFDSYLKLGCGRIDFAHMHRYVQIPTRQLLVNSNRRVLSYEFGTE